MSEGRLRCTGPVRPDTAMQAGGTQMQKHRKTARANAYPAFLPPVWGRIYAAKAADCRHFAHNTIAPDRSFPNRGPKPEMLDASARPCS